MPLYEYECELCGAKFEVIQRFSDAAIEACRKCGGPVHKLISAPAIQFKGTGWYITDYPKKNGGKPSETSSSTSSSESESKSKSERDAKSESKSDGKSDGKSGSASASTSSTSAGSSSSGSAGSTAKKD